MISCPFCDLSGSAFGCDRQIASNKHATALLDGYPVSDGHTLVVPKRHAASVFDLSGEEQSDVWALVAEARDKIRSRLKTQPDGFNIGPNDGIQAGQTVMHAHVHLIPRYKDDVPDPRGGIRWVLPHKANYWAPDEADPFQQVEFLGFVQSLLERGQFVSTYKFALLQALADIAIESEPCADGTLRIPISLIAEKFISYYWCQAAPFHLASGDRVILQQNKGPTNIAVLSLVSHAKITFTTLAHARSSGRHWSSLVSRVARQVKDMPLFKLQNIGGRQVEVLYKNEARGSTIVLNKGVQDCFRRFYGIVIRLARREWLDMIRRLNPGTIGAPLDLEEFTFGSKRSLWLGIRPLLLEIQGGQCFYCQRAMRAGHDELDHFIPWSLYPNDLAHNFVLSCRTCNGRKSDDLASLSDLDRWVERNRQFGASIAALAISIGLAANEAVSEKVTTWAYAHCGMKIAKGPNPVDH
jgi:diadenosine tetraphosphate (Ap4A) HIT family hydrolase